MKFPSLNINIHHIYGCINKGHRIINTKMDEVGVRGPGSFLFGYFKTGRTFILAQLLCLIIQMLFSKSSMAFKLGTISVMLSFQLLPIIITELIDRIINNDKPDLLHVAVLYFDWYDLYFFTLSFVGSCIGAFIGHRRNEKARLASQENQKEGP